MNDESYRRTIGQILKGKPIGASIEIMDANRKKVRVPLVFCSRCGKPYAHKNPDGIGIQFLPKKDPYCICEVTIPGTQEGT